ncbi:MAG TPA: RNA 2',3'-cyclic phosphodiesterase [Candidatus Sumerlaeota bacterium]|nr:RNA 2',3'-cyclic phosphodiesterase [Candidatus Sumerlaeota bacterium]HNM46420.1 RNA 2',3'-cyclic phosphodiesterase [Candidatus Sumerlaeota bacterium]
MHNEPITIDKKRLFFAVEVCPEVRDTIAETVSRLQKAAHFTPAQVLWSPSENYHITLYFLGSVPVSTADSLRNFVQTEKPPVAPFKLDFRHISTFPEGRGQLPKVLWAGVHNPPAELKQLRAWTGGLIARAKLPVPDQNFTPHVTVARFKGTKGLFPFRKLLEAYKFQKFGTCHVARIVLMESITGNGPARYEPFATANLQP